MYEIIMILGIIGFIFVWFYYGYGGAEKIKDDTKYQYTLILKEKAWKRCDNIFYYFCILTGLISYFSISFMSDIDILKIQNNKNLLREFSDNYKDMKGYEDNSLLYLKRIEDYENDIEGPYYKKYKIDLCKYCQNIGNCNLEHYDFDLCYVFKHIKALD